MRLVAFALLLLLSACHPRAGGERPDDAASRAWHRQLWAGLKPLAQSRGIDPGFVYALAKMESGFDPHARRGEARGLLQIKPRAWKAASPLPYEPAVWDWRTNLSVGVESLASLKSELERRGVFSYGLLWAAHHYGLEYVEQHHFELGRIPRPSDPVALRLLAGDPHPVAPPEEEPRP